VDDIFFFCHPTEVEQDGLSKDHTHPDSAYNRQHHSAHSDEEGNNQQQQEQEQQEQLRDTSQHGHVRALEDENKDQLIIAHQEEEHNQIDQLGSNSPSFNSSDKTTEIQDRSFHPDPTTHTQVASDKSDTIANPNDTSALQTNQQFANDQPPSNPQKPKTFAAVLKSSPTHMQQHHPVSPQNPLPSQHTGQQHEIPRPRFQQAVQTPQQPHSILQPNLPNKPFLKHNPMSVGSSVYVRNIPYTASYEKLEQLFCEFGSIHSINMNSVSKGFTFISYVETDAAQRAIAYSKNKPLLLDNRILSIDEKKTKPSQARIQTHSRGGGNRSNRERRTGVVPDQGFGAPRRVPLQFMNST